MITRIFSRISFAIRHKTARRMTLLHSNTSFIVIWHKERVTKLKRLCPHQGGPLEKGCFDGDCLVCPWHGCRFSLIKMQPPQPYVSTIGKG